MKVAFHMLGGQQDLCLVSISCSVCVFILPVARCIYDYYYFQGMPKPVLQHEVVRAQETF